MSDATLPVKSAGVPVRHLNVSVRSGPDAGKLVFDEQRVSVGSAQGNSLLLTDRSVSRFHLELERSTGGVLLRDLGSTNGTGVAGVRFRSTSVSVDPGVLVELGETVLQIDDGEALLVGHGPRQFGGIFGRSGSMRRLLASVERVAASDVPVLLLGESGTGKELVGRALHDASPRAEAAFVIVDCGALSPTLFASELFGHERGAFTGALKPRVGAIERAHGGTLFLDEIGDLPAELQAALLGVLERGTFRRLGGDVDIRVDVRVVSATSRELRRDVNDGRFRLDLFYRLAVVLLEIPALRERPDDVPELVAHFLAECSPPRHVASVFSDTALEALKRHSWPGNVRELKNHVLGALAMGKPPELFVDGAPVPSPAGLDGYFDGLPLSYRPARQDVTDKFERHYLARLLTRANGNVREAARLGQINRSYLIELLKRHGFR